MQPNALLAWQNFNIVKSGSYTMAGRPSSPSGNDDSFTTDAGAVVGH
jgi:hypothetical protein